MRPNDRRRRGGGYFYDFTRTWSLGYATPETQKMYDQVQEIYNKVVANLKVNTSFKEYQRMTCEYFEAKGHSTQLSVDVPIDGYVHSLGHGLGLNVHERGYGLTSVHNMNGDIKDLRVYQKLEERGEMLLRVYVPFLVYPEMKPDILSEAVEMRSASTNKVRGGLVKFFMDGVIETGTGLLLDDYEGRPGWRGTAQFEPEHFTELALEADKHGLQIAVHCTGDGAVRRVLDTYEIVQRQNGQRDSRHRIEHIELVGDSDVPRFAELGVIAAMQPLHSPTEIGSIDPWPARVGPARYRRSFAWQTLRDAGAHLAFGSDWTVADMNPITGIHAALNRTPWQDGDPNQSQTLEDTLLGYTRDAAYAEHMEHEKGILKEGCLADVVMLSEDIFQTPKEELLRVKAVLTICDGEITYEE